MSNETPQQDLPIAPVVAPKVNHLEELNKLREPINKAIQGLLPIIAELRKENAALKVQLAEAQKKA
jgi:prefoldin subunit 5